MEEKNLNSRNKERNLKEDLKKPTHALWIIAIILTIVGAALKIKLLLWAIPAYIVGYSLYILIRGRMKGKRNKDFVSASRDAFSQVCENNGWKKWDKNKKHLIVLLIFYTDLKQ